MCRTRRKNHKYCSILFSIDVSIVSQSGKNKEENIPIQQIQKSWEFPWNPTRNTTCFAQSRTTIHDCSKPRRKNNDQTITLSIYFFDSWGKWRYVYFMFGSLKLWLMGIYKGIVMDFSDSFGMWMSSSLFFLMFLGILWWNVMHIVMDFHGSWGLKWLNQTLMEIQIGKNMGNTKYEYDGQNRAFVEW